MLRSATKTSTSIVASTVWGKPRQPSGVMMVCRIRKVHKSTTTPPSTAASAAASATSGTTASTTGSTAASTVTSSSMLPSSTRKVIQEYNSLVRNPKIKEALPYIGNGAYLALASGFLMTDMLSLRVALVGGYVGLVSFHALHPRPLQIPLRWSALFVLVNAGAAYMLAMDRYGPPLSEEEERLYHNHFSQLSKGEFSQLLVLSKREVVPDGTILTREGRVCPRLYFIEKGTAKVFHHGAFASSVDEGGFVNDVAFQIGEHEGAYGTVVTEGDASLLFWDQVELRKHLKSKPDMESNTKYLLSEHLMRALLNQRDAKRWNQNKLQEQ
ncbi:unnamed protein product [Cylindrotheca closterium]|uniref:Cyclic nucleotide-binding domain-containing protein n=1 Tax=Cylindrotheca closterium TaxID=2856 RepID=A0AAD2CUZ4_9STRA|nr:unnamed protein product [Cylindrotheca closterium]